MEQMLEHFKERHRMRIGIKQQDLLIIHCPYVLKRDALKRKHDEIAEMRKTGTIVLDGTAGINFVPFGTKIIVEDAKLQMEV